MSAMVRIETHDYKGEARRRKLAEMFRIAEEVIEGKWGNGVDRIQLLEQEGHDSAKIQNIVNVLLRERGKK